VVGHAPAPVDLFGVDLPRALGRIAVPAAHLFERPGQVDRGRPGGGERGAGGGEILPVAGGERVPVRGRDPDRRRPTHGERADRLGYLRRRPADEIDLLVRQAPLIEENDAVVLEPDDPIGFEHSPESKRRCPRIISARVGDEARRGRACFELQGQSHSGTVPPNCRDRPLWGQSL